MVGAPTGALQCVQRLHLRHEDNDHDELAVLEKIHTHISQHGMPGNSLTLRAILGRPARTMHAYLEELSQGAKSSF